MKNILFTEDIVVPYNTARVEHLKLLNLPLKNKTILETGCGGSGSLTKVLHSYEPYSITLNDVRYENIILLLLNNISNNLYSIKDFNNWDLNNLDNVSEKFDIIFSYGTLYHLHDPENFIKNSSRMCNDFIIIETIVNKNNDESCISVQENSNANNQSFTNMGSRPSRLYVLKTLSKYFKYAFICNEGPKHNDFIKDWNNITHDGDCRCIFLGCHNINNIDLTYWSSTI